MDGHEQNARMQLLLREAMEDASRGTPAAVPSWEQLEGGLRRVRRRRRATAASAVGAGLLAVAVVAVGIRAGALPDVRSAPPASRVHGPSKLVSGQPRGSLAKDQAWLQGLRRAIADSPPHEETDIPEAGGDVRRWSPPAYEDIHVLYAGDVGEIRLALVEGPWRRSNGGIPPTPTPGKPRGDAAEVTWRQFWYLGGPGEQPAEMQPQRMERPSDTAMWVDYSVLYGGNQDAGSPPKQLPVPVVVVSTEAVEVLVDGPPRYEADGNVRLDTLSVAPSEPGVYETVVVAVSLPQRLRVPAMRYHYWLKIDREPDTTEYARLDLSPLHGKPPADEEASDLASIALEEAVQRANVRPKDAAARLLWTGDIHGRPHSVAAVTVPSGAHAIAVIDNGSEDPEGPYNPSGAVLPEGPLEGVAFAWPIAEELYMEERPKPTGEVAVLGPVGAVSATYLGADGTALKTVSLKDGFAMVKAPKAKRVQFSDAGDSVFAEVPVAPLLQPGEALYDAAAR